MRGQGVRGDSDSFTKHPPMVGALQAEDLGPQTRRNFGIHGLRPGEVVFAGRHDEPRASLGIRRILTQRSGA